MDGLLYLFNYLWVNTVPRLAEGLATPKYGLKFIRF